MTMTQLPDRLNNHLRREPADLLEVVRHNYQTELDSAVHATFPVVLRQSLATIILRTVKLAGVAMASTLIAYLVTGEDSVSVLAGIITSIVGVVLTGSEVALGIVAVTDHDFALIELDKKASFESGKIIESITIVSNPLPQPRATRHGMDGEALPFKKDDDRGWHYAGLTDKGTTYMTLLEELKEFQHAAEIEKFNVPAEPQLVRKSLQ